MVQAVNSGAALRIGVVGVGVMGSNHARVLAGLSGIELVGVADPDPAQRELVARGLGCTVVNDLDALLKLGVDAATIAAPTHLHHQIALSCIARGVHVLVEKPIASSVEEGRDTDGGWLDRKGLPPAGKISTGLALAGLAGLAIAGGLAIAARRNGRRRLGA